MMKGILRCAPALAIAIATLGCEPAESSRSEADASQSDANQGDGAALSAGDPSSEPTGGVNGQRLRMQHWQTDDGALLPVGYYDTELDTPCSFGLAADGVVRCLPVIGASIQGIVAPHSSPTFIDAACKAAVVDVGATQTDCVPAFASLHFDPVEHDCEKQKRRYWRVTSDVVTGQVPVYWWDAKTGDCVLLEVDQGGVRDCDENVCFLVGPELLPSAFVAGDLVVQ